MKLASTLYVLNRLLERPIDSMGRARLLDKISSVWAKPIRLTKNRVNGNQAHLLDKLLTFGPERLFNESALRSEPPITPINHVGAIPTHFCSIQISPRYVTTTWTMDH